MTYVLVSFLIVVNKYLTEKSEGRKDLFQLMVSSSSIYGCLLHAFGLKAVVLGACAGGCSSLPAKQEVEKTAGKGL